MGPYINIGVLFNCWSKFYRWRSEDRINDADEQWSEEFPMKRNSFSNKRSDSNESDQHSQSFKQRDSYENDRRSKRAASVREDRRFSTLSRRNNSSIVDRYKQSTGDDGSDKRSNLETRSKVRTSAEDRTFENKTTRRSFDRDLPPRGTSPNRRELLRDPASSSFDSSDKRSEGQRSFSVGSPVRSTGDLDNDNSEANNLSNNHNDEKKNDVMGDKTKAVVKKSRHRLLKKGSKHCEEPDSGNQQSSRSTPESHKGEWACEHCTFLNKETDRVCNVCCKTRRSALPPSEFDEPSKPPPSSKAERAVHKKMSNLKISNSEESGDNSSAKNKGSFRRKISFSFGTKPLKP